MSPSSGMWDFCSSLTRDQSCAFYSGAQGFHHWSTKEVPRLSSLSKGTKKYKKNQMSLWGMDRAVHLTWVLLLGSRGRGRSWFGSRFGSRNEVLGPPLSMARPHPLPASCEAASHQPPPCLAGHRGHAGLQLRSSASSFLRAAMARARCLRSSSLPLRPQLGERGREGAGSGDRRPRLPLHASSIGVYPPAPAQVSAPLLLPLASPPLPQTQPSSPTPQPGSGLIPPSCPSLLFAPITTL